jgi:hypothetical protein
MKQKTCKERVQPSLESTLDTLRLLWAGYTGENCETCDGEGEIEKDCEHCQKGAVSSYSPSEGITRQKPCIACDGENIQLVGCEDCEGRGTIGDEDGYVKDLGNLHEYGLCFDYVAPGTFGEGQKEPYWRYQLSWGGPSSEFRIYGNTTGEYSASIYRIEYWFLDWFDGASITLHGEELAFMEELILSFFGESGTMYHVLKEAIDS